MVSAFSFGIRQNEQKKEADKAAEVEKSRIFLRNQYKKQRKNIEVGLDIKGKSAYNRIKYCKNM